MTRIAAVVIAVLLLAGCGSSSRSSGGGTGPIVFSSSGSGSKPGILRREPDGRVSRLTTGRRDYFPSWSPDGSKIVFERGFGSEGASHLMVMNADGSDLHQVGMAETDTNGVSWGPDDRIAFGGRNGLTVIKSDGTGLDVLVPDATNPAWSPDGKTIVFKKGPSLYAANADGSNVNTLVATPEASTKAFYVIGFPAWSPDGKQLAFVRTNLMSMDRGGVVQIADADGTGARTLAAAGYNEGISPSWSPDGKQIVFAGARDQRYGIWTVPSSGGAPKLLIEGLSYAMPSWRPSGT